MNIASLPVTRKQFHQNSHFAFRRLFFVKKKRKEKEIKPVTATNTTNRWSSYSNKKNALKWAG